MGDVGQELVFHLQLLLAAAVQFSDQAVPFDGVPDGPDRAGVDLAFH